MGRRLGKVTPGPEGTGRWYRLARAVMRHPGVVAALTAVALLLVATPAIGIRWSGIDASVLPTGQSARTVSDPIAQDFPGADSTPGYSRSAPPPRRPGAPHLRRRAVPDVRRLSRLSAARPGPRHLGHRPRRSWYADHTRVAAPRQRDPGAARALSRSGRWRDGRPDDQHAATSRTLPIAIALLILRTISVLWLMTGSVVLPIKALLMNLLTTAATAGILVLIFQDGNLTGPLGFTKPEGIEQTNFLVLVAIVFGLSTDYGVFLLTRIKEAHDSGLANADAVAVGLQRTGAIVTAAAILLAVALGAFVTSQLVFLKELGVGAAVAVLIDAFVVRALLVPALMGLLGSANWWSPRPLRRLHQRLGVAESTPGLTTDSPP